jgi:hypothetical protein
MQEYVKKIRINSIIGQLLAKIYYVNLTMKTGDGFIKQSSERVVMERDC